jgi:hypothetical protein
VLHTSTISGGCFDLAAVGLRRADLWLLQTVLLLEQRSYSEPSLSSVGPSA